MVMNNRNKGIRRSCANDTFVKQLLVQVRLARLTYQNIAVFFLGQSLESFCGKSARKFSETRESSKFE